MGHPYGLEMIDENRWPIGGDSSVVLDRWYGALISAPLAEPKQPKGVYLAHDSTRVFLDPSSIKVEGVQKKDAVSKSQVELTRFQSTVLFLSLKSDVCFS